MEPNTNVQNSPNPNPVMNSMPPVPPSHKKVGPIIGALVIILILIIAVLYFFGQKLDTNTTEQAPIEQVSDENEANLSSSSEVQSIQAELDAELQEVDYSF